MKPSTVTEEGVVTDTEKEMASSFTSDFSWIALRVSNISEKCEGKKALLLSDLTILASKNQDRACVKFSEKKGKCEWAR